MPQAAGKVADGKIKIGWKARPGSLRERNFQTFLSRSLTIFTVAV